MGTNAAIILPATNPNPRRSNEHQYVYVHFDGYDVAEQVARIIRGVGLDTTVATLAEGDWSYIRADENGERTHQPAHVTPVPNFGGRYDDDRRPDGPEYDTVRNVHGQFTYVVNLTNADHVNALLMVNPPAPADVG